MYDPTFNTNLPAQVPPLSQKLRPAKGSVPWKDSWYKQLRCYLPRSPNQGLTVSSAADSNPGAAGLSWELQEEETSGLKTQDAFFQDSDQMSVLREVFPRHSPGHDYSLPS